MVKATKDQVGTMAEARKSSVGLTPELLGSFRCRVRTEPWHHDRNHCSTIHNCLYCNATSAESNSVFVRSTHLPSYRASSAISASSIRKPRDERPGTARPADGVSWQGQARPMEAGQPLTPARVPAATRWLRRATASSERGGRA